MSPRMDPRELPEWLQLEARQEKARRRRKALRPFLWLALYAIAALVGLVVLPALAGGLS